MEEGRGLMPSPVYHEYVKGLTKKQEDKLDAIFRMQEEFDKLVEKRGLLPIAPDERIDKLCTAILHEAVELQDLTPWKWWKKHEKFPWDEAVIELIDILHFVISAAIVLGLTPKEFFEYYNNKMEINKKRQEEGY